MYTIVSVLLAYSTLVAAEICCSPQDAATVIEQWNGVVSSEHSGRVKILLMRKMVNHAIPNIPELAKFLVGVDMDAPVVIALWNRFVTNGIELTIHSLADPYVSREILAHLSAQHAARPGITRESLLKMAKSVAYVMRQVVPNFAEDAWDGCMEMIAKGVGEQLAS